MSETNPHRRRIGVFTSGRQDWWILQPVAQAIQAHPGLEPIVFISGTHGLDAFGNTGQAVRASGLPCVDVPMRPAAGDSSAAIGPLDLAEMASQLAQAMHAHPIDVMVVLGDRIETLMASVMVVADGRFLAHTHGGDRAPAEFDDAARHAITKLAHVHFPATPAARERIERMGEPAWRVHLTGSPSIDGVLAGGLATSEEARRAVALPAEGPFVVLLYHPSGQGDTSEAAAAAQLAQGIVDAGLPAVCLAPNGDPGRAGIWRTWQDFSRRHNWPIAPSVERRIFLRLIHDAVALVGNSSAGMVESAAVQAAVLNVGPRQTARERSANVVDVPAERSAVSDALRRLQADAAWANSLRAAPCVFGDGRASQRIAEILASMELSNESRIKLNEY